MLDYRRKFIEAAQRYLEISYRPTVEDSERMTSLEHALHCTILASAGEAMFLFEEDVQNFDDFDAKPFVFLSGQQRSRMLATLFKDERCQQLPACGILRKM